MDWERGWDLQVTGSGLKVSAWIGKQLVGRLWLPSEMRPRMAAGPDDRLYLPASWMREAAGKLHLLLESVSTSPAGELNNLKFILDG
jgi:hypothetical protein